MVILPYRLGLAVPAPTEQEENSLSVLKSRFPPGMGAAQPSLKPQACWWAETRKDSESTGLSATDVREMSPFDCLAPLSVGHYWATP